MACNDEQEIAQARKLRAEGKTLKAISKKMHHSMDVVRRWCDGMPNVVGRFSKEDKERAITLWHLGTPTAKIAEKVGCSVPAANSWIAAARKHVPCRSLPAAIKPKPIPIPEDPIHLRPWCGEPVEVTEKRCTRCESCGTSIDKSHYEPKKPEPSISSVRHNGTPMPATNTYYRERLAPWLMF